LNQGIEVDSLGTVLKCVGKKTPKEINSYLNAMDICILPGTNWYCSPMKLLEYGAVGKPVIAVDMPNVREIADNENLVVFFNKNDSRDLADKIKLLCGNNELRRKIASNFRNHVLGNFSWYNNAEKIMYVFKKLSETNNHTIRN
jgi:glycosyltransferase involved in cell wall biosynthesis